MKPIENDKTYATVLDHNGEPTNVPTIVLSSEEAALLRLYKKFLLRHGFREALYCNKCFEGSRADGTRAHVTDSQVMVKCRCRMLFHQGQTY